MHLLRPGPLGGVDGQHGLEQGGQVGARGTDRGRHLWHRGEAMVRGLASSAACTPLDPHLGGLLLVAQLVHDLVLVVLGVVGRLSRQHKDGHQRQGPDVHLGADRRVLELLGRSVQDRQAPALGDVALGVGQHRQTKVGEDGLARCVADEDVLGLEVVMEDGPV